jgi:phosphoribosylamine--glycine ligase
VALLADPDVTEVVVAPGNAGIAEIAQTRPLDVTDPAQVAEVALSAGADLVVVGPEGPLVAGAADAVRAAGIPCFGPSAEAARLEGSKAFAKEVMAEAGVPTALAHICETDEQVAIALDQFGPPYVVKDDGLAAGKGVVVTSDRAAAAAHASACLATGGAVVVEEFLDGPEVSLFAITDGTTSLALQPAQDFKRVGEGDTGPNTGGMGAYAPLPWVPADLEREVLERVVDPVVEHMHRRGTPFAGLLYAGLALTSRGLRVVEFNARFGDPETQVVLANLRTPLGALLLAAATGHLDQVAPLVWESGYAVTVVVAAAGYPEAPRSGDAIGGLAEAGGVPGVVVLHAGTRRRDDGAIVTSGGRVLSVTARGDTVESARAHAYAAVDLLHIDGAHHRRDIAGGRIPT